MTHCPHCGRAVRENQVSRGTCPQCGRALTAGAQPDSEETVAVTAAGLFASDPQDRVADVWRDVGSASDIGATIRVRGDEPSTTQVRESDSSPPAIGGESGVGQSMQSVDDTWPGLQPLTLPSLPGRSLPERTRSGSDPSESQYDTWPEGTPRARAAGSTLEGETHEAGLQGEDETVRLVGSGSAPPEALEQTEPAVEPGTQQEIPLLEEDDGPVDPVIQPRSFSNRQVQERRRADYELVRRLGEGGMGVVHAARQASIGRVVAVKMLKGDGRGADHARRKFLTEAVITGDLEHPNIVPVYDLGADQQGALFYSMKRVQGIPWKNVLASKTQTENLEILMRVADAVAFAHARGVVHLDLKPENVMLGEFGEVLLMDWGLARATPKFRKTQNLARPDEIGGTPAFMAPEMAQGLHDRIGTGSDVYLLGAILYQILTGRPPHTGKNVAGCLLAAAKNEIVPTDKTGELVDIARKAMATQIEDRYATVRAFQAAIREYQSHSESVLLATRAEDDLARAGQTDDYDDYLKARFGFQEALELWPENATARGGLSRARLAYAGSALKKGDYDVGISTLDPADPSHESLLGDLRAAKADREARKQRERRLRNALRATVALIVVIVGGAAVWINSERAEAVYQRGVAETEKLKAQQAANAEREAKDAAIAAEKDALNQKAIAENQRNRAEELAEKERLQRIATEQQRTRADRQRTRAEISRWLAEWGRLRATAAERLAESAQIAAEVAQAQEATQRAAAEAAKNDAVLARQKAEQEEENARRAQALAQEQRDRAEYEGYVARIGLAAARIEVNAFDTARQLLLSAVPQNPDQADHRGWEWGRLMYLGSLSLRTLEAGAPVHSFDISPDGRLLAAGGWGDGLVSLWDLRTGERIDSFTPGGSHIHAVAFAPDGRHLAIGSNDGGAMLRLWDLDARRTVRTFDGHTDAVLCAVFTRDGRRLLTSAYDGTCRLWDVETGNPIRVYVGHDWWVWSVAFSPDETRFVSASQDGTALIWDVATGDKSAPFLGHAGPVLAAAFAPDGRRIATAGQDRRILLWQPDDLADVDLRDVADGRPVAPTPFQSFTGHSGPVRTLRFSSDGRTLLSGADDNTVRLWDTAAGSEIRAFRGHDGPVHDARFAGEASLVYSASQDGTLRQWSSEEYREHRELGTRLLEGHVDAVLSAAFSRDGRHVVTSSRDRTARTWNADTGELEQTFSEGHKYLAMSAVFSADGTRLYTGAFDNTVRIWDVAIGSEIDRLEGTGRFATLALSPDDRRLLTGAAGTDARLWDLETRTVLHTLSGHSSPVMAAAISPDGALLATGDMTGEVRLWDAETGALRHTLRVHTRRVVGLAFLAGGNELLSASADRTVARWDTGSGEALADAVLTHPAAVSGLAVLPDGTRAATSCDDGRVRLWDLDTRQIVATFSLDDSDNPVSAVDVSADGRHLLAADSVGRRVHVWDLETGRPLHAGGPAFLDLHARGGSLWTARFAPSGNVLTVGGSSTRLWDLHTARPLMSFSPNGAVAAAQLSPDGTRAVTASWDGSVRVWDAATGKALLELKGTAGHSAAVNSVAFSPDGSRLLTASDDGTARIWNAQTGEVLRTLVGHTGRVQSAAYSSDGARIVTASRDGTARLWNAESGEMLATLRGHDGPVLCARFSDDGRTAVTGGADKTACLWDVSNPAAPNVLLRLSGHTGSILAAALSPDAERIATASGDGTVKIWDAGTGRELLTLDRHTDAVNSVTFSPDGLRLLTAGWDGRAILWLAQDWK